ncbi:hypothetical protein JCM14076_02000 [Methylosoma difficile]
MNESQPPNRPSIKLPYFDFLLSSLTEDNDALAKSFGKHVHWGYWPEPKQATLTVEDFEQAAEALSQQVCAAGHIQNGQDVLDVGCGFGGTTAHINDNYSDMRLTGLNIDERQLERARATVIAKPANRIEFKQGDACALPFADESFDVVLAVECIFHFPDREQFFKEAYRVLKPGGYLALSDFLPNHKLFPLSAIKMPSWSFYGKCNVDFSINHYRKLAEKIQLTNTLEHDITTNTLPTYSYLRRLAVKQKITSLIAMVETVGLEALSRLNWVNYYVLGWRK